MNHCGLLYLGYWETYVTSFNMDPLTPDEMIAAFNTLIDDVHDDVNTVQLMNYARMLVEHARPWEYLKAVDETQVANAGDTYLSMKSLPSDFRAMRKVIVGTTPYTGCQFEERILHKDRAHRYYIDVANNQFALTGNRTQTQTIVQVYTKRSPALVEGGDPWIFPGDYHNIIPHIMAGVHQGTIDPDDIARQQGQSQGGIINNILSSMFMWDDELKMSSMGDSLGYSENPRDIELSQM